MRKDGYGHPLNVVGDDIIAALKQRLSLTRPEQKQRASGACTELEVFMGAGAGDEREYVTCDGFAYLHLEHAVLKSLELGCAGATGTRGLSTWK